MLVRWSEGLLHFCCLMSSNEAVFFIYSCFAYLRVLFKLSCPPQDYSHTKAYRTLQSITTHIVFRKENKLEVLVSPGEEFPHQPQRYFSGIIAAILNNVGSQF